MTDEPVQCHVTSWKVQGIRDLHNQRAEVEDTALSEAEAEEFRGCEEVIEHGLKTFFEVGLALIAIRDLQLYRTSYPTFEEYCRNRWGAVRARHG
jgi:hypothetical protein